MGYEGKDRDGRSLGERSGTCGACAGTGCDLDERGAVTRCADCEGFGSASEEEMGAPGEEEGI